MRSDEGSQVLEDWKKIARMDWERVKRNLRDQDVVAAGFFLQQCLEKFLKAFLLAHGWKLRKIHRLDVLLDEAIKCIIWRSIHEQNSRGESQRLGCGISILAKER